MKVFVWERVGECSDNYHSEGGVVVFAATEERARKLANTRKGCNILPDEKPDEVRWVLDGDDVDGVEAVYIMPDAGCC